MRRCDLLIVGAGPAGMAAAITARRYDLDVIVVDEQQGPGGQIWRSIEVTDRRDGILGPAYAEGRSIAKAFRASGATYLEGAQLWEMEGAFRAFISKDRTAEPIEARAIILATGAQERPVPFPGWTLPGVLTVGAAQILLKNAGQVPSESVWIAGSGPLPLLYAVQLLKAGGKIAGYLDTTAAGQWRRALRHLPRALRASRDLFKGLAWSRVLEKSGTPIFRGVTDIEAYGDGRIKNIRYRTQDGGLKQGAADLLLVHEGIVPNVHVALAMKCAVAWNVGQDCFVPVLDDWGESSQENIFIVGDSAGIAGARAALYRGELAALRVAHRTGRLTDRDKELAARRVRRKLTRELAARPFLDALFKPRPAIFAPTDATIVCRCEEVTAGQIRKLASVGRPGPNQMKTATRAGMGPCQGRQCAYTVTRILADLQKRSCTDVGFLHVRPPLKPVTLGELACLDEISTSQQAPAAAHADRTESNDPKSIFEGNQCE